MAVGDLSPHFSRSEFDCHDGTKAAPTPELIAALERVRHLAGDHPLQIVSGFRTVAWNRRVGGAPNSQHLWNRAADIPYGRVSIAQAEAAGFTGIGFAGHWAVHLDVRPGQRVVFPDS